MNSAQQPSSSDSRRDPASPDPASVDPSHDAASGDPSHDAASGDSSRDAASAAHASPSIADAPLSGDGAPGDEAPGALTPDRDAETPDERDARLQRSLRERGEMPTHVACIMDGNGRWARRRNRMRYVGHREGVSSVRDVTEACAQIGVEYLTLYTFSTENWNRPELEVNALMELLVRTVEKEKPTLMKNDVRLETIGDLSQLPDACQDALQRTKDDTAGNDRMTLTLALSYSGRWEILRAARALAERAQRGDLDPDAIDESLFDAHLDTAGQPDPDLLIRTGGEYRLSNFLLWQCAYTELFITERYWPDFRREQLYEAIRSFQERDRRFGRVQPPASKDAS